MIIACRQHNFVLIISQKKSLTAHQISSHISRCRQALIFAFKFASTSVKEAPKNYSSHSQPWRSEIFMSFTPAQAVKRSILRFCWVCEWRTLFTLERVSTTHCAKNLTTKQLNVESFCDLSCGEIRLVRISNIFSMRSLMSSMCVAHEHERARAGEKWAKACDNGQLADFICPTLVPAIVTLLLYHDNVDLVRHISRRILYDLLERKEKVKFAKKSDRDVMNGMNREGWKKHSSSEFATLSVKFAHKRAQNSKNVCFHY